MIFDNDVADPCSPWLTLAYRRCLWDRVRHPPDLDVVYPDGLHVVSDDLDCELVDAVRRAVDERQALRAAYRGTVDGQADGVQVQVHRDLEELRNDPVPNPDCDG